jgi:hypothetical protein
MGPRIDTDINISPPAVTELFDAVEIMLRDTHFRVMLFLLHVFRFVEEVLSAYDTLDAALELWGDPHM